MAFRPTPGCICCVEHSESFWPFLLRGMKLWRVDPHGCQFSEPLFMIKTRRDFVCGGVDHEKPRGVIGVWRRVLSRLDSSENVVAGVAELGDVRPDNTLPALGGRLYKTCLGATRKENRVPIRQRLTSAAADKKNHHPNNERNESLLTMRRRHCSPGFSDGYDHRRNGGARWFATNARIL